MTFHSFKKYYSLFKEKTGEAWKKLIFSLQPMVEKVEFLLNRYVQFDRRPLWMRVSIIVGGILAGFFSLWLLGRLGGLVLTKTCTAVLDSGVTSRIGRRVKPVIVEAAKVSPGTISRRIQTVGRLRPNHSVTLKAEINGRIEEIAVKEGSIVEKDDLLIQFDDRDAKAELMEAEATLELREAAFKRSEAIKKIEAAKNYDEAKAGLEIARAKVATAKARLSKMQIRASFSGTMGLIEPSVGAYVQAGQEIGTLVDNNPMKVDFKIPERNLLEVGVGQGVEIRMDGFADKMFLATVEAIDSKVDAQSHSIPVRATVPNASGDLRGGLFANINLIVGEKGGILLVPESALERDGDIEYVWVIRRSKAMRQKVLTGSKEKGNIEIIAGLNSGDLVVVTGQMRLGGDGSLVKVLNLNDDGTERLQDEKKKIEDEDAKADEKEDAKAG